MHALDRRRVVVRRWREIDIVRARSSRTTRDRRRDTRKRRILRYYVCTVGLGAHVIAVGPRAFIFIVLVMSSSLLLLLLFLIRRSPLYYRIVLYYYVSLARPARFTSTKRCLDVRPYRAQQVCSTNPSAQRSILFPASMVLNVFFGFKQTL